MKFRVGRLACCLLLAHKGSPLGLSARGFALLRPSSSIAARLYSTPLPTRSSSSYPAVPVPHSAYVLDTASVPFSRAYDLANAFLSSQAVPDADISARYLLCDVAKAGYRLSDFHRANSDEAWVLSTEQMQQLSRHCSQRAERVPVQYIIGNWDFYGLTLECRAPVLIPRPETEELVERILESRGVDCGKTLAEMEDSHILDVGAGTGAIGIALLHALNSNGGGKGFKCVGIDINPAAVSLSLLNAQRVLASFNPAFSYTCRETSFMSYALSGVDDKKFDLIVSNPPYIPSDELLDLEPEVAKYEDPRALHGGTDGLDVVRELLDQAGRLLRPGGRRELWMEVARRHPDMIQDLLSVSDEADEEAEPGSEGENCRWELLEKIVDLAGNPRFVRLRLKE